MKKPKFAYKYMNKDVWIRIYEMIYLSWLPIVPNMGNGQNLNMNSC
jgi:hypothetical protein